MKPGSAGSLIEILAGRKHAIIREWLTRTFRSYPDLVSRFLSSEEDPFRNPVGHTLKESLGPLLDAILDGVDAVSVTGALEAVVRLRAVQDFRPGQAVGFLFLLKRVIREELCRPTHPPLSPMGGEDKGEGASQAEDLVALENRIDELALLAFDLFMQCRERLYEIRVREARRRIGVLLKRGAMEGRTGETASGDVGPPSGVKPPPGWNPARRENRGNGDADPPSSDSPMPRFTDPATEDGSTP